MTTSTFIARSRRPRGVRRRKEASSSHRGLAKYLCVEVEAGGRDDVPREPRPREAQDFVAELGTVVEVSEERRRQPLGIPRGDQKRLVQRELRERAHVGDDRGNTPRQRLHSNPALTGVDV